MENLDFENSFEYQFNIGDVIEEHTNTVVREIEWGDEGETHTGFLVSLKQNGDEHTFQVNLEKTILMSQLFPNLIEPFFIGEMDIEGELSKCVIFEKVGAPLSSIQNPLIKLKAIQDVWITIKQLNNSGKTFGDKLNLNNVFVNIDENGLLQTTITIPHKIISVSVNLKNQERRFVSEFLKDNFRVILPDQFLLQDSYIGKIMEGIETRLQNKSSKKRAITDILRRR